MEDSRVQTVRRMIRKDALSTTFVVTPLALWLLWGVVVLLPPLLNGQAPAVSWEMPLVLVGLTGLCWLAALWRASVIKAVLTNGGRVEGLITGVWFFQARGRVECSYTYLGQAYRTKVTLIKDEQTSQFTVGALLMLAVDPDDPKRIFIPELFQ